MVFSKEEKMTRIIAILIFLTPMGCLQTLPDAIRSVKGEAKEKKLDSKEYLKQLKEALNE